jgi:hypothetical protein
LVIFEVKQYHVEILEKDLQEILKQKPTETKMSKNIKIGVINFNNSVNNKKAKISQKKEVIYPK